MKEIKIQSLYADKDHPQDVSSPKMLDIFLGTPVHHLLIYTGIAIPEWDSQSSADPEQVQVHLERPIGSDGNPFNVTQLVHYTATVGLASIENKDSDFVFATEDVGVSLTAGGELVLVSNISVTGEPSWLHRFSYQVNAIIDVDEPLISGIIFWSATLASPTDENATATLNRTDDLFTVRAVVIPPAPDNPFGGGGPPQVVAVGEVTGTLLEQPADFQERFPGGFSVPYVIRNVPLDVPVHVQVEIQPGAFTPHFSPTDLDLRQVSGPDPITLTLGHMKEPNVNFELFSKQLH